MKKLLLAELLKYLTGKIALTTDDLLKFIGRTKLHEEISSGRLRCHKLGRKNIFLVTDVAEWLESMPQRKTDVDGDIEIDSPT